MYSHFLQVIEILCCNSPKDAAGYFDTTLHAAALAIDAIRREKMTLEPIGQYRGIF
ncbi:MAG: hypothetical protein NTW33_02515 [Methanoregula sp.]|nr:hypothetical protein [Methanoregula sp.]